MNLMAGVFAEFSHGPRDIILFPDKECTVNALREVTIQINFIKVYVRCLKKLKKTLLKVSKKIRFG